jgi:hypothetical protein
MTMHACNARNGRVHVADEVVVGDQLVPVVWRLLEVDNLKKGLPDTSRDSIEAQRIAW